MKEMESQTKTSLKLQAYQYLKTKILNLSLIHIFPLFMRKAKRSAFKIVWRYTPEAP